MSYRRMRWIIISEVVLVLALIVLALALPQAGVFITPIVVVVAVLQIFIITRGKKNNRR